MGIVAGLYHYFPKVYGRKMVEPRIRSLPALTVPRQPVATPSTARQHVLSIAPLPPIDFAPFLLSRLATIPEDRRSHRLQLRRQLLTRREAVR